ncbi:hypothetical protein [Dorea sp. D27]|uniref:hypothetical protein n=1 Tax=Dorea sp. D27 TaxID=658665 RepID=UPI000673C36C|nr:hypothetical protein [Dorea sp. D27]
MKSKRIIAAAVLTLVLASSVLTGCSDEREDRLEDKVDKLEQQVTDLESKKDGTGSENGSTDSSASGTSAQGQDGSSSAGSTDYETLKAAAEAAADKVNSASPSGTAAEQREQFYTLKNELDDIDHQLDLYDDNLENEYRSGSLDASSYRQQERDIDALEDILDTAEDRLEVLFGIDD